MLVETSRAFPFDRCLRRIGLSTSRSWMRRLRRRGWLGRVLLRSVGEVVDEVVGVERSRRFGGLVWICAAVCSKGF